MAGREQFWNTAANRKNEDAVQAEESGVHGGVDWTRLAREAFHAGNVFINASLRNEWEDNLRLFQNRHPQGSKYHGQDYIHRSKIFRPKTRSMVRKHEAAVATAFFANQDITNVSAQDDNDPEQLASADFWQEVLQYRLGRGTIPWFLTVVGAAQDASILGYCVSKQYWDYEEVNEGADLAPEMGEDGAPMLDDAGRPMLTEQPRTRVLKDVPACRLIPPENIRIDRAANWIDPVGTSPYFIEMIPMYVGEVREKMRATDPKTGQPEWIQHGDATILQAKNNDYNSTRQAREDYRQDSKDTQTSIRDHDIVWVHDNHIRHRGKNWNFFTLSTNALLSEPVDAEEVYPYAEHGRPYTMGFAVLETHKIYPSGKVHLGAQLQNEVNDVTNLRLDNVKLAINGRNFVKRGRRVDLNALRRSAPSSTVLMDDPEKDVVMVRAPDVTSSSFQEQDRLSIEYDDLLGNFTQTSVQSNRKLNETVGGMNLMSQGANAMTDYDLRLFSTSWVEPTLRQLLKVEQMYETDLTVMAMSARRAKISQRYGVDQITDAMTRHDLILNVKVGMGATDPDARMNRFWAGMKSVAELFGDEAVRNANMEEIISEVFGILGYSDGSRFFNFEEDPERERLEAMIQELQQALETEQMKYQSAQQIAGMKAQADTQIAGMKAQSEMQRAQLDADTKLKEQMLESRTDIEEQELENQGRLEVERLKGQIAQIVAGMKARSDERTARMGNRATLATEHMKAQQQRKTGNGRGTQTRN